MLYCYVRIGALPSATGVNEIHRLVTLAIARQTQNKHLKLEGHLLEVYSNVITYCHLLPIKMYSKFVLPNWTLFKPVTGRYFEFCMYSCYER